MRRPDKWLTNKIHSAAIDALMKFVPYSTGAQGLYVEEPEPPYHREFDPRWIYKIRENHSLINNAIEEKVSQTFRRGWDDWEKEYEAKCPNCKEEFGDETPFRQQAGGAIPEDTEIDFDSPRVCPECEQKVEMMTPDPDTKDRAKNYFKNANHRNLPADHLQPTPEAGVGQTFLEVCKEVGWDIQSFDDGWMIFDRSYKLDANGKIIDYELEGVHRGPPDLMRYVIDEDSGNFGGEYWVCVKCRASDPDYRPEREATPCSECGSKTYQAFAYAAKTPTGNEPVQFYIRGEFAHASEYEPSKYYGYSPIVTLFDEARTMEQMDDWYRSAYEQRRAPRGALIIRSSNADSTRKWNRGQLEKLNNDANHIPTLMDDTEGGGGSDPIKFVNLLETPAEMQHMEMREWIKERISGKYGVTAVMMSGSPENSGLSQSMEVQVSNRSADRLRTIFNEVFVPAFLGQIGVEGWTREIAPVEEEDEMAEAEKQQRQLQIAQQAAQLGLQVEWTDEQSARVKPGEVENPNEQEGAGGGLGAMLGGGGPDEGPDAGPPQSDGQPQLEPAEQEGGAPDQDKRPAEDNPAFGRSAKRDPQMVHLYKALNAGYEVEVYNDEGRWEKAKKVGEDGSSVIAKTEESEVSFELEPDGTVKGVA